MTSGLKGFQNFEVDTVTGFPICPKTRKIIDGTVPYCKSCFSFGIIKYHSMDVENMMSGLLKMKTRKKENKKQKL